MELDDRVKQRIADVASHLDEMEHERQGWGFTAMNDVNSTARSFVAALGVLMAAERVWIDGGIGYSFGGVMPGGIVFGMIARFGPGGQFDSKPIEWTFHS